MKDFSFLRLKDNISDALNIGDSPVTTHYFFNPIQLLPNKSYLQITNYNNGISLDSDCEVFVVDCNDNVLADITDNVFIEEFNDTSGNNQCKIEYINLGVDFYRQTVLIKFDMLASDAVFYTNPINITEYESERTSYFKYKNYDDFMGIGYTNANVWQSISLAMYFDIPIDETETEDYFQISRNKTISTRALYKPFEQYHIEQINRFTYERLNVLLKHELIYQDDERVTNKPVVSSSERLGDSNVFETNLTVAKDCNDVSPYTFQVYDGLQYDTFSPINTITPCDGISELNITFNVDVTLQIGIINVYTSGGVLVETFNETQMNVTDNVLTVDVVGSAFENPVIGNYYFNISGGLVQSIFTEENEIISDDTTWTVRISSGDYSIDDYNDNDYNTDCP